MRKWTKRAFLLCILASDVFVVYAAACTVNAADEGLNITKLRLEKNMKEKIYMQGNGNRK